MVPYDLYYLFLRGVYCSLLPKTDGLHDYFGFISSEKEIHFSETETTGHSILTVRRQIDNLRV